jgi:hypothetical protein
MQLNLPILHLLQNSQNILIAGAGGGFDIYSGLPIYFTLRDMGKNVQLANYSFSEFALAKHVGEIIEEIPTMLIGAKGELKIDMYYYTEGYLADWFAKQEDEQIIWMLPNEGPEAVKVAYKALVKKYNIDTLILVDGGVDSLARGDEQGPGSMLEDTISLLAVEELDIPIKILASIGFGTEVEESVDHYAALENMAGLIKGGGFYGSCSLTSQMDVFLKFEAACRHAWEGENRSKSHISTRIIPAAHGEFGDFHMYESRTRVFISPLMSIYWFFDANVVLKRNLAADSMRGTITKDEARHHLLMWVATQNIQKRRRKSIPY